MRYFVRKAEGHTFLDLDKQLLLDKYLQYPIMIKINDIHANVFSTDDNTWWIGAMYHHNIGVFPLIGPYDNLETAIVFYRLLGDVSRPSFD